MIISFCILIALEIKHCLTHPFFIVEEQNLKIEIAHFFKLFIVLSGEKKIIERKDEEGMIY